MNKGGLKSGQWYLVPTGHYRFRLQVDYNQEGPAIHVVTLDLEERDVPSSEGVQRLGPDAQPVAITLRPDDLGIWRGEISIEAPVDPAGSARPVVSFTRLGSVSTRLGDFHIEGADSISVPGRPYLEHPNAMSLVVVTPTSLSPLIKGPAEYPLVAPFKPSSSGWKLTIEGKPSFSSTELDSTPPDRIILYAVLKMEQKPAVLPMPSNSPVPALPQELLKQAESKQSKRAPACPTGRPGKRLRGSIARR